MERDREEDTLLLFIVCVFVCVWGGEKGEKGDIYIYIYDTQYIYHTYYVYMIANQVYIENFVGMKRKEELRNCITILSFLNFLLNL